MRKSPEHRSLPDLLPLSLKPEPATSDLASARSITLMIHGVGNTTDQKLLTAAAEGYYESGLGVISERLTLSECPTLFGKKGAESMVFQRSGGPHFLVALPWAEHRPGLSRIALWLAVVLLALAALATATFEFRDTIDSLRIWLRPLSHRLAAYLVIMALSYFAHVLNPRNAKREFKPPSMFILILPPVLLLGLEYFVEATWLWIPFALLVVTLWLMSTVIVMRCLRIATTLGWRLALATLIVALALPGLASLRVAWQSAVRAAEAQRAESEYRYIPYGARPAPDWLQRLSPPIRQEQGNANSDPRTGNSHPTGASERTADYYLRNGKPEAQLKVSPNKNDVDAWARDREALRKLPRSPRIRPDQGNANADPRTNSGTPTAASHRTAKDDLRNVKRPPQLKVSPNKNDVDAAPSVRDIIDDPMKLLNTPPARLTSRPVRLRDLVTENEFVSKLSVVAICVALCLFLWFFSWLLDFGLDVLNYVGHKKHRVSLIDGTAKTIRWFHDQAPNTPIIVVGHSLGSVIASHAIGSLSALEPCLRQIVLVTLGSPLNYLNRAFPESVQAARGLSQSICASARWINLWRRYDVVGKALNIEAIGTLQYCVGSGGHQNYWSDGAVWRAVAREALGISDGAEREILSTRGTCLFERWLGPLVFAAIAVFALCGAGLWAISP